MAQPSKHPKTGVYRVCLTIPAPLRDTAAALVGRRAELIENLGTKDPAAARQLAPAAIARLDATLAAIRAHHAGQRASLSDRDVAALAGEHYSACAATLGDNPGTPEQWEVYADTLADQIGAPDPDTGRRDVEPSAFDRQAARGLLASRGYPADPDTVERLARAVLFARWAMADLGARRARGDWSPDRHAETYPPLLPAPDVSAVPDAAPVGTTFNALLAGLAADRGWGTLDARPISRALYDRHRTLERLAAFVGHRDAAGVTKADAVRWKEEMQGRDLHAATIRNDISEMSALWRWGMANGKVVANPFQGVAPPKAKRRKTAVRPYTDGEAASILRAARQERGALRWLPWVACLTGARITEIAQADKADVVVVDGVRCLRIHDEGEGHSVKNEASIRAVPLHPALIAEGFGSYVDALPTGAALFPDLAPDRLFGSRGNTGGKLVRTWLRKAQKITDPTIHANHSFRHWLVDAARKAGLHPDVRHALTGHVAEANAARHYGHGMGAFAAVLAAGMAQIVPPLPPATA